LITPGGDILQARLSRAGRRYIEDAMARYDNKVPVASCPPRNNQPVETG